MRAGAKIQNWLEKSARDNKEYGQQAAVEKFDFLRKIRLFRQVGLELIEITSELHILPDKEYITMNSYNKWKWLPL